MANRIIHKTLEGDVRIVPLHPQIEGIVQEEIGPQRRAYSPYNLANFFFRAGITWTWLEPEHHFHLVMGHLHALDQCADHLPFPAPIGLCQPVWDLRGKVFQAAP
jgi:hypothetical protein